MTANRHEKRAQAVAKRKAFKAKGFATGYTGQKYEVTCDFAGVPGYVVGWSKQPDGGDMLQLVERHPSMSNPVVREMTQEEINSVRKRFAGAR